MAILEKIPVVGEKKYSYEGLFDINGTYLHMKGYLEDAKYFDVSEKDYDEKNVDGSRKIMTKLEAEKLYNDYYKIIIKYELLMEGKDIEIQTEHKTIKLTKGKARIIANAYLEPDWQHGRDKNALHQFLGKVYDKFVGHDEQSNVMKIAGGDVADLMKKFKEHMNTTVK
ncbi:MAG: hypothetical protein PF569_03100 [Candidatus Woesearchaeota archaeon]|jgi:hypothetical protein|nr:hypothetical protein [Candidatus Woesearchaeota archaeon]